MCVLYLCLLVMFECVPLVFVFLLHWVFDMVCMICMYSWLSVNVSVVFVICVFIALVFVLCPMSFVMCLRVFLYVFVCFFGLVCSVSFVLCVCGHVLLLMFCICVDCVFAFVCGV